MKKKLNVIMILAFLSISFAAKSQDENQRDRKRYDNFKERSISKSYPASGNNLSIINGFGDVKVTTWDKNEIKVDIHIEVSSTDKDVAEKTFAKIDVTDLQKGRDISFKTEHKDNSDGCKNCKTNMSIDYDVHIPASNDLDIENSFGDITMQDHTGAVSLKSSFGKLTAGRLQKVNKLFVEFGKADIKSLNNIDASFKFSTVNIDLLGGSNKIHMEFCKFSKLTLSPDLSSLSLNESYSTVNLRPAAGFSASYDISTSFGSVVDHANIGIKRTDEPDRYGPDSDKKYEGRSGSGAAKITARSSFGKIIIGEATEEEMKAHEKDKRPKGTRV